jgi:hypothetical protein
MQARYDLRNGQTSADYDECASQDEQCDADNGIHARPCLR